MSENSNTANCANCARLELELETLRQQLAALKATVDTLQQQLAAARKNSSTSSKPPSSDIVKPKDSLPSNADSSNPTPKSIGAQPGHSLHSRLPFPPESVHATFEHSLHACPCCSRVLFRKSSPPIVQQQVDILSPPLRIEHHSAPGFFCSFCQKTFHASMPLHIQHGGLAGVELTTLIAYLKGVCHASFSTIRKFVRDVVQISISRGQLAKIISKVSQALEQPYEELLAALPGQATLNVDETGHKDNGARFWTWCFRAELFSLYHIDGHRSADVLMEHLGRDFKGVLGCDYFSAYRRYMRECNVRVQFCLAHLIRDVKYLTTLPNKQEQEYGQRLRDGLKELFKVIHEQEKMSKTEFDRQLAAARERILQAGRTNVPKGRSSQNMQKRLQKHGAAYFEFISTPGVEPTNNLAEQAIRFVVIDRMITQGTRSETGRKWSERIWSVIATCSQQGKSVYEYLKAAITNWFKDEAAPSLLGASTANGA